MERETILAKIRKLLALSENNTNQNEAIAAALKAQKLISDYDVSQAELHDSHDEDQIIDFETARYKSRQWRPSLASAIAQNFRCRSYIHHFYSEQKPGHHADQCIHFYGYECDARAAAMVYEKLVEIGERLAKAEAKKQRDLWGTSAGVKNTFLNGFIYGVYGELSKQSQALMIVVPKAVNDSYAQLMNGSPAARAFKPSGVVVDATAQGVTAGRDAVRASRLEHAQSSHVLTA